MTIRSARQITVFGLLLALWPAILLTAMARDDDALLTQLEQQRLTAISQGDSKALRKLLTDDYLHVHATGKVEDAREFVASVAARPRESTRGELKRRIYGDVALIVGEQRNLTRSVDGSTVITSYVATQVARRERSRWRYLSMQLTPLQANDQASLVTADEANYAPGAVPSRYSTDQRAVAALEARRAKSIADKDAAALRDVLADDYLHVYGGGTQSDREAYIAAIIATPRMPTRGPLQIRVMGDVAVVTGNLLNRIQYVNQPERALDTFVTQVARRQSGQWKFVSFQITQKTRS
jgi:ketosteroid isomerase-like protein